MGNKLKEPIDVATKERPVIRKVDGNYIVTFMGFSIDYCTNTYPETLSFLKKRYPTATVEKN